MQFGPKDINLATGRSYVGVDLGMTGSDYIGSHNFLWGIVSITDALYNAPQLATYLPFNNLGSGIGFVGGAKVGFSLGMSVDIEAKFRFMTNYSSRQEFHSGIQLDPNVSSAIAGGTSQYSLLLSSLDGALLGHVRLNDHYYAAAGFGLSQLTKNGFNGSQQLSGSYVNLINHSYTNVSSQQAPETDLANWFFGYRTDIQVGGGTVYRLGATNMMLDAELLLSIPLTRWLTNEADSSTRATASYWLQTTAISDPRLWYLTLTVGLRLPFHALPPPPAPEVPSPPPPPQKPVDIPISSLFSSDTSGSPFSLSGHVKDAASGKPLVASLTGVDLSNNQVFLKSVTDSNGNYSLRVNKPGKYSITAEADGHLFATAEFEVDSQGRILKNPSDIALGAITGGKTRMLIFFDFDKADLQPASTPELNRAVTMMQNVPTIKVEIAGYSDSLGSLPHNIDLSLRRAKAVREYLIQHGISGDRIVAQGHGPASPIATNSTDEGRAENRRVEFVIR